MSVGFILSRDLRVKEISPEKNGMSTRNEGMEQCEKLGFPNG